MSGYKALTEFPINGLNRQDPPYMLRKGQVQKSKNLISDGTRLFKPDGTTRYNTTSLGNKPITWATRYYGRRTDGTLVNYQFVYWDGAIYVGDDFAKTFTKKYEGLNKDVYPKGVLLQQSGNSMLYLMTGTDVVKYDGNAGPTWEKAAITHQFIGGEAWLDRLWGFTEKSSILYYSKTLYPEDFTDSTDAGQINIGNAKSGYIVAVKVYQDRLYIFKSDSIWYINGRLPSTWAVRQAPSNIGCAAQHSVIEVEAGLMYLGHTGEFYAFDGMYSAIQSSELQFKTLVDGTKLDKVCGVYYDNWARFAFEPAEKEPGATYNSDEVLFTTIRKNDKSLPIWNHTRGARVSCYCTWGLQGDSSELLTGRSDIGLLMYHGRTKNYDGTAMKIDFKSRDIPLSANMRMRIKETLLNMKPTGDNNIAYQLYPDGRTEDYFEIGVNLRGENKGLGFIVIDTQNRFEQVVGIDIDKAICSSYAFGFTNNDADLDFELYSHTAVVKPFRTRISKEVGV